MIVFMVTLFGVSLFAAFLFYCGLVEESAWASWTDYYDEDAFDSMFSKLEKEILK